MKSKSSLKSKTSLKVNKPLLSKTTLSASKTPKKQKKPTITKLKKEAWKQFSRYVRLRDSDWRGDGWYGKCITCSHAGRVAWIDETGKLRMDKGWDAGHYISRGNWFLRHDEENVNLQCKYHCNNMKSGNPEKYKVELDLKYGDGTREKLDRLARENPAYYTPVAELEQIISDAKEACLFYEAQVN